MASTTASKVNAAVQATRSAIGSSAPLTWAEYAAKVAGAPKGPDGKVATVTDVLAEVHIKASDFANGSLRIAYPGIFRLVGENGEAGAVLSVNPTLDNACRPRPHQLAPGGTYGPPASNPAAANPFFLGFFASLVVTADDATYGTQLDMNGCTLEQGGCFYAAQTVYAHVELGNSPFIMGQGPDPKGFVATFQAPRNVHITNGTFGRSSHHAVHGNAARYVLLDHLTIRDYEVAGIALNGARHVAVDDTRVLNTISPAPSDVFRVATMMDFFVPRALAAASAAGDIVTGGGVYKALLGAWDALRSDVREIQDWYQAGAPVGGLSASAATLLGEGAHPNASAAYGIVAHPVGVAVNDFVQGGCGDGAAAIPDEGAPRDWRISHTFVQGLTLAPRETPALWSRAAKKVYNFFMGTVFEPGAPVGSGAYRINTIGLLTAWLSRLYTARTGTALPGLGTLFLPDEAFATAPAWLREPPAAPANFASTGEPASLAGVTVFPAATAPPTYPDGADPLRQLLQASVTKAAVVVRGADIQFHVNKGPLGIRAGGVQGLTLDAVAVEGVTNLGAAGNVAHLPGEPAAAIAYRNGYDGGHPAQKSLDGYMGADSHGVRLSACTAVVGRAVQVRSVHAENGSAVGIEVDNISKDVDLQCGGIAGITTGCTVFTGWANAVTQCTTDGVLVSDGSCRTTVHADYVKCVSGPAAAPLRATSQHSVTLSAGHQHLPAALGAAGGAAQ